LDGRNCHPDDDKRGGDDDVCDPGSPGYGLHPSGQSRSYAKMLPLCNPTRNLGHSKKMRKSLSPNYIRERAIQC
jgi:hypothetical protein